MQSLPEIQVRFAAALADAARATDALPLFRGASERSLARLAIYRGNFHENCSRALACAYPIVRKIVGVEFFDSIARAYIRARPSQNGDLNLYGERLQEFLVEYSPTADLAYLPDVAGMEWLAHVAYFAAAHAPVDVEAIGKIPPDRFETLRVRLAPECALLESAWPLGRIWTIHQDDYEGDFNVDLDGRPDRVVVYRPAWRARVLSLAPGDFRFLSAALRGETLVDALVDAAADPQFDPSTALGRWINAQIVVALV